jgi:hypothetical protein
VEKTLRGKVQKQTFPPSLEIPQKARDSHFPTAPTAADVLLQRPRPKTQTRRKSHYPWTKNGGQVTIWEPLSPHKMKMLRLVTRHLRNYLDDVLGTSLVEACPILWQAFDFAILILTSDRGERPSRAF